MDRLLAQDAILQLLLSFNTSLDTLSRPLFLSAFSPTTPATFDASAHIPGAEPLTLLPPALWDAMWSAVAGFSAVQHLLGPPTFTFKDERLTEAQVEVNAWAYHCVHGEDGSVRDMTTRVVERADVRVEGGRWVLGRVAVVREVPLGNMGLYAVAAERVKRGLGRRARE